MKLDKELEETIMHNLPIDYDHTKSARSFIQDALPAIKSVILEALKAEMPKEKSIEIPSQYGLKMTDKVEGYNLALNDCLNVCNKLLGDSNE